jgi:hypothetical protein
MTNSPLDDMQIIKTIDPEQLDGRKVLMAICEINGCFGNIDKTGRLTYKFLGTSGLFPSEMTKAETLSYYKQSETHFEDYVVIRLTRYKLGRRKGIWGLITVQGKIVIYSKVISSCMENPMNSFLRLLQQL